MTHPGALALVEVKCSQALVDEIRRLGGRLEFTRTSHSLIKARMREVGAFFAGEYYGFDDAVYAAGPLLRTLSDTDKPLSSLAAEIPHYYATPEVRVACPDERKFDVVGSLRREFRTKYQVIDVGGARIVFPDGWALVRASNTPPVLVVRAPAADAFLAGVSLDWTVSGRTDIYIGYDAFWSANQSNQVGTAGVQFHI